MNNSFTGKLRCISDTFLHSPAPQRVCDHYNTGLTGYMVAQPLSHIHELQLEGQHSNTPRLRMNASEHQEKLITLG